MGDFIVSLNLELKNADKNPEDKVKSMKDQFSELYACTQELRTLLTAQELPRIKVVEVATFCNANKGMNVVKRIVDVPDKILPEVQLAILNIINCLNPEHRKVLEMELIYQQMSLGAAEKYVREYMELYNVKVPVNKLQREPRVLWLSEKYIDIGHAGNCEVKECVGIIVNAQ